MSVLLTTAQLQELRSTAEVLIPGDGVSPSPAALHDFDELLGRAAAAMEPELPALSDALSALPSKIDWVTLRRFAESDGPRFELIATIVTGAYFMSEPVLESIGYPTGNRAAAPFDLSAEELASGILDPVIDRGALREAVPNSSETAQVSDGPGDQLELSSPKRQADHPKGRGNVEH